MKINTNNSSERSVAEQPVCEQKWTQCQVDGIDLQVVLSQTVSLRSEAVGLKN